MHSVEDLARRLNDRVDVFVARLVYPSRGDGTLRVLVDGADALMAIALTDEERAKLGLRVVRIPDRSWACAQQPDDVETRRGGAPQPASTAKQLARSARCAAGSRATWADPERRAARLAKLRATRARKSLQPSAAANPDQSAEITPSDFGLAARSAEGWVA